jgi:hypothetical protein
MPATIRVGVQAVVFSCLNVVYVGLIVKHEEKWIV